MHASEGRGTGALVGRLASVFRRDLGNTPPVVSLPERVRLSRSRSPATPMRSLKHLAMAFSETQAHPRMHLGYPNVNTDLFRAHSSHDLPLDCHTFLAPCQISSMIAATRKTVRAGSTLRFPLDTSTAIALILVDVGQMTNRSCRRRTRYFDEQRIASALVKSGIHDRL